MECNRCRTSETLIWLPALVTIFICSILLSPPPVSPLRPFALSTLHAPSRGGHRQVRSVSDLPPVSCVHIRPLCFVVNLTYLKISRVNRWLAEVCRRSSILLGTTHRRSRRARETITTEGGHRNHENKEKWTPRASRRSVRTEETGARCVRCEWRHWGIEAREMGGARTPQPDLATPSRHLRLPYLPAAPHSEMLLKSGQGTRRARAHAQEKSGGDTCGRDPSG